MNKPTQKITPFLWFDHQAEEAVNFYTSIFRNSKVETVARYGETGPGPKGTVMTISFQLAGQQFIALNGGPHFKFTEAISFVVNCETQEEVDEYWEKLSEGGAEVECGWLKRQIWHVMANRSHGLGRVATGQGCRTIAKSHESSASNEEN
jgi:predicted 3-demethylubiquinone-9 3-methyltransferase (glyoxalase superfamily)